jgi:hypothetical protein
MLVVLFSVLLVGWVAAALLGTQAYFRGEQVKPIHERNWNSTDFEQLAQSITGQATNFDERVPAYGGDAFSSELIDRNYF